MKKRRGRLDLEKKNQPGVIYWHGDPHAQRIALTFDDGPNEPYTLQVLDILDKYNIKATFFMIGKNVKKFPETAGKVADAGHVIGNHTYNHRGPLLDTPLRAANELNRAEEVIKKIISTPLYLFRPPYGATNRWVLRQAERLGYVICQWSVNAGDWRKANPRKIIRKVLSEVENGAIILMHDGRNLAAGHDRSSTVAALPEIIVALQDKGYSFVTVPQLLELEVNSIKNNPPTSTEAGGTSNGVNKG